MSHRRQRFGSDSRFRAEGEEAWPRSPPRPGGRRDRRGEQIDLALDHLETRTLLSVSAIIRSDAVVVHAGPAQETLNLQLQPGSAGALSQLTAPDHGRGRDRPGDDGLRALRSCRGPPRTWTSSPSSSRPTRPSSMPTPHRPSRT